MNLVLSGPIDDALVSAVRAAARPGRLVAMHARAVRLEHVEATPPIRSSVASICDFAHVDHAFVDHEPGFGHYGLLAMDMDSTLITIECIDEIADFVGKKKEVAAITEATMRGDIADFKESLRRRVALLAGVRAEVMEHVFDDRLQLTEGARQLVDVANDSGAYTMLVSGGFTYFTNRLAISLTLDAAHGNTLEVLDGVLTGRIAGPIIGPAEKAQLVRTAMSERQISPNNVIVIGDGANDISMMHAVTHSVAFRAKPQVVAVATHAIRYGSLTAAVDYFS